MDLNWLESNFPDLKRFRAFSPTGQKEVFAAEHVHEGPVVLKIFKPGADAERIAREMTSPLKVKSSRVPNVSELGRTISPTGEIVWLREKRIEGSSLKDLLASKKTLDSLSTVRIGLHVTEVLADAEAADVVHRDIKPGNIIIAPDGSAWVIDFGLARHLDMESVTPTAQAFAPCTPGFAPVEQFTNQKADVDARADLFGLGVTLYVCLEGKNPFTHGTRTATECFERVATMPLPRVSDSLAPRELIEFIEAATRTRAEHRPTSAAEALAWIQEIAAGQGVK